MINIYFNLNGKKSKSQTYRQIYKGYRIYINEDTIANIYAVHLYKNGDLICNACRGHAGELCVFTKGYKETSFYSIYTMLKKVLTILKSEEVPLILSLEYLSNFNQYVFSNYVNKKLYKHKGSYVIPFSDKTWTAKLLDK